MEKKPGIWTDRQQMNWQGGGKNMLNIVLFEPEIPANTGNIGRTCVATGTRLHLIEPLGFRINEKSLKRAGMDYWKDLDVTTYIDYQDFLDKNPGAKIYMATTKAEKVYTDVAYEEDCYIMRLKPLKSKNMLVNILDYFRPLKIEKNPDNIESIKHETCHIISQSVRGNALKNKDIRDFMARNGEFLEDMRFLLEERTNLSIFPAFYFQNKYKNKLLELFKNYKVNEYKQIHILSTLKRSLKKKNLHTTYLHTAKALQLMILMTGHIRLKNFLHLIKSWKLLILH